MNNINSKFAFISAIILGFLAVSFGAFGAHGLKGMLSNYQLGIWQTAVEYQMYHAIVLLFTSLLKDSKAARVASKLFLFGSLLFSGSLYLLAITEIGLLGAITPIGGILLLGGWTTLVFTLKGNIDKA
ncbi:DUF423 domain-containing protein [Psychrosphaera haliotis]|uniref:DUF423 domain-containing protein n=1 Tax=Psychrosphaera haliotis TaxID=555083 RepID=A0A6N8F8L7_9GAMM|nr:DUF423 domain-containing protein [Psychrosphaera haliotis]MUH71739.1 DUF423 domain-containing protein [Psychrosphaera haliotis]